jgi:thiamine transport system substrate-binding protein
MRFTRLLLMISVVALILSACTSTATPVETTSTEPVTLTVMTHDSFAVSEALVRQFEEDNNVTIVFAKSGATGAALNLAVLSKEAPRARDVFYGVDNTFLTRALEAGIFEAYDSPLLADIPEAFKLDPPTAPYRWITGLCASTTTKPTSVRKACLCRLPWMICSSLNITACW